MLLRKFMFFLQMRNERKEPQWRQPALGNGNYKACLPWGKGVQKGKKATGDTNLNGKLAITDMN